MNGGWDLALGVLLASALIGSCAATPPAYGPGWSAVHADAANSDFSPVSVGDDLALAWSRDFPGAINLGATAGPDGRLYVTTGGADCRLHVLDPHSGKTLWCDRELDAYAIASSPLIDRQGRAFLADGTAMRAYAPDGKLLWKTPIVGFPLSAQFTPKGRLVFITHIGRIYVLRRDTGEPVMTPVELTPGAGFDPSKGGRACMRGLPECPSANTPAIDLSTGRLFFTYWTPGAASAGIRAMRIEEGAVTTITPLWVNESLPGGSASSPDISADGSRIYLTDNAGGLHALDAATGRDIWSFQIGFESGGSPSTSPDGIIMPSGGGRGGLLALKDQGASAELLWRNDALVNRGVPTQAAGGRAYAAVDAGGRANDLLVIDTRTGAILDRERLPGTTVFTVGTTVGQDGTVYVPTIRGQLFAFRAGPKRVR